MSAGGLEVREYEEKVVKFSGPAGVILVSELAAAINTLPNGWHVVDMGLSRGPISDGGRVEGYFVVRGPSYDRATS